MVYYYRAGGLATLSLNWGFFIDILPIVAFDKSFRHFIFKFTSFDFCFGVKRIFRQNGINLCKSSCSSLSNVLHHLIELARLQHLKLPSQHCPFLFQQTDQFPLR